MKNFRCLITREYEKNKFSRKVENKSIDDLPEGDVLVAVYYSSLNYKDALSATGNRGVTRRYPHTPGVDAVGIVEESSLNEFSKGDKVIVCGYGLGTRIAGGFSEYIRVPGEWVVKLPSGLTMRQSMMLGTAGFTAAKCVAELIAEGVTPESGKVLVTGATGGVGSISVAILAHLGFHITAVTGKDENEYLTGLGASEIIARDKMVKPARKLLLIQQWAGVVDTVGGQYLETAIRETKYDGVVTCCGNAASADLSLSVYPFILRGVRLVGIDAAECSLESRKQVWNKLAKEWKIDQMDDLASIITLDELDDAIDKILDGKLLGRAVVQLREEK